MGDSSTSGTLSEASCESSTLSPLCVCALDAIEWYLAWYGFVAKEHILLL